MLWFGQVDELILPDQPNADREKRYWSDPIGRELFFLHIEESVTTAVAPPSREGLDRTCRWLQGAMAAALDGEESKLTAFVFSRWVSFSSASPRR
ncbi:hypothetical protein GQ600_23151 [Phytophthora cactorum]|nr:hypothetical protein GQ600_23151 [Phytophthora cactorum]